MSLVHHMQTQEQKSVPSQDFPTVIPVSTLFHLVTTSKVKLSLTVSPLSSQTFHSQNDLFQSFPRSTVPSEATYCWSLSRIGPWTVFSVLAITFSAYGSILSLWQERISTIRAHLLTQFLVILMRSTMLWQSPGLLAHASHQQQRKLKLIGSD